MFEKLVVALDLCEDGDRALPIVQALARTGPVAVELVTVSDPVMSTAVDAYELERRAVRYGWDRDSWTVVRDTDPAAGLVQHAARWDDSMLVMATTAKRPLSSSVFGSVTRDVLHHSEGPVLLIGPRVPSDFAPVATTLVVGVERGTRNVRTVPTVASWLSTFASGPTRLAAVVRSSDEGHDARTQLDELAAGLAAQGLHASTDVVVADDPVTGLAEASAGLDGCVYVVVSARYTDGRLHWHSTTQRLVAQATCPVLVVPARPTLLPLRPVVEEHEAFHDRTARAFDLESAGR